ncbi:hypothetical protein FN846DRAFT_903853 [Sphaerosporella brunnea]|uniref:Uncharacterized protein n=1 Tax=Sphaerosporella brunnea TaxID=1250544 RepID=A0A5J5F6E7_9PEZI|nr:hypothetical protein FN846DRAFT_903853 [Sphaerosporella brunnea]
MATGSAAGWTPPLNPHPMAPTVAFTNWVNNRPSWIAVTNSTLKLPDTDQAAQLQGRHHPDETGRAALAQPCVPVYDLDIPDFHATHAVVINSLYKEAVPAPPTSMADHLDGAVSCEWAGRVDPLKARRIVEDWILSLRPTASHELTTEMDAADAESLAQLPDIAVGEEASADCNGACSGCARAVETEDLSGAVCRLVHTSTDEALPATTDDVVNCQAGIVADEHSGLL